MHRNRPDAARQGKNVRLKSPSAAADDRSISSVVDAADDVQGSIAARYAHPRRRLNVNRPSGESFALTRPPLDDDRFGDDPENTHDGRFQSSAFCLSQACDTRSLSRAETVARLFLRRLCDAVARSFFSNIS